MSKMDSQKGCNFEPIIFNSMASKLTTLTNSKPAKEQLELTFSPYLCTTTLRSISRKTTKSITITENLL